MGKKFFVLLICVWANSLFAQNREGQLKIIIDSLIKEVDSARYGIAFKDLQTGYVFNLNDKISFHAASTMKTPVMLEVFKQVKQKKFGLYDSVVVRDHFKSIVDGSDYVLSPDDDSDSLVYSWVGKNKTVYDLVFQMITMSSNLATNILIEKVDPKNIMQTMKQMGAKDIRVLRGVEDNKAFEKGLNNTTTAHDLLLLMEAIATRKAISPKASVLMTDILLQQHYKEEIPALLPSTVKVAHKTGWINGIRHDSGFLILPNGKKYVLVILSQFPPEKDAQNVIVMQHIAKALYDYLIL